MTPEEPEAPTPRETYVETGRPNAGGRWHVYDGDHVGYEPQDGSPRDAVINAATLRNGPAWPRLEAPQAAPDSVESRPQW